MFGIGIMAQNIPDKSSEAFALNFQLLLLHPKNPQELTSFLKQKVRQLKSAHRKTQTPIVAKQISSNQKDIPYTITDGICVFTKFIR